jgi:hypothetical protein
MIHPHRGTVAAAFVVIFTLAAQSSAARAEDFLSGLFGVFVGRPPAVSTRMSYGGPEDEARPASPAAPLRLGGASRVAFCVRGCDGRYFPVAASDGESAATICNSFCPASPTRMVYGSSIDSAATSSGQSYSDLPNAFRYRTELVAGCSCNGKDAFGLAPVKIDDDRTLRKGDIVAGANGLVVATGRVDRRRTASFTPAPASIRSKYERLPVVAAE